jgi:hypothetical protein
VTREKYGPVTKILWLPHKAVGRCQQGNGGLGDRPYYYAKAPNCGRALRQQPTVELERYYVTGVELGERLVLNSVHGRTILLPVDGVVG